MGQTQLEVNWTQIDHFIPLKITKMAISKNAKSGFWTQIFLEALIKNSLSMSFAKFTFTSILKFQTNSLKNVGGVGILVIDTWPKWHFEIPPFLWFLED